jgi:hypothetical protein
MGSPGHADIVAGSAHPTWSAHDDQGGFVARDDYPPLSRQGSLSPEGDLPMLLWEGDLTVAGEGELIVPSLWEIDSRSESNNENFWKIVLPQQVSSAQTSIGAVMARPIEVTDSPVEGNLPRPPVQSTNGNRPIGIEQHPGWSAPRGQSIVLTYQRANYWAALPARTTPDSDAFALPPGGMVMRFVDVPSGAAYVLFLQLKRIS